MDRWIVIPRWDEFQHRDMARSSVPPWIKLYTKLMSDDEFLGLSFHLRGLLVSLWLEYAAARRQLSGSTVALTRRLGQRVTVRDLESLNHAGFIEVSASKPAGAHAGKAAGLEVEVDKKVLVATPKTEPRITVLWTATVAAERPSQRPAGRHTRIRSWPRQKRCHHRAVRARRLRPRRRDPRRTPPAATRMTDREYRLRQRIDQITDQRDHALDQLARCRRAAPRAWNRTARLRQSLELWRTRALRQ